MAALKTNLACLRWQYIVYEVSTHFRYDIVLRQYLTTTLGTADRWSSDSNGLSNGCLLSSIINLLQSSRRVNWRPKLHSVLRWKLCVITVMTVRELEMASETLAVSDESIFTALSRRSFKPCFCKVLARMLCTHMRSWSWSWLYKIKTSYSYFRWEILNLELLSLPRVVVSTSPVTGNTTIMQIKYSVVNCFVFYSIIWLQNKLFIIMFIWESRCIKFKIMQCLLFCHPLPTVTHCLIQYSPLPNTDHCLMMTTA